MKLINKALIISLAGFLLLFLNACKDDNGDTILLNLIEYLHKTTKWLVLLSIQFLLALLKKMLLMKPFHLLWMQHLLLVLIPGYWN